MDKAALLQSIREAEAKAAKDLEDARARKQAALVAAQAEADRARKEGAQAADGAAASQLAEARKRVDADKKAKLTEGRARIQRKREQAEARVSEVAGYLVSEFERHVQAGLR